MAEVYGWTIQPHGLDQAVNKKKNTVSTPSKFKSCFLFTGRFHLHQFSGLTFHQISLKCVKRFQNTPSARETNKSHTKYTPTAAAAAAAPRRCISSDRPAQAAKNKVIKRINVRLLINRDDVMCRLMDRSFVGGGEGDAAVGFAANDG